MQDAAGLRQAMEYYDGQGWTDGLPVVPVTESYLASFLARAGRDPDDVLLDMPHLNRALTVRLAAINAALAGCLPEYFPVVLAAWESLVAEGYVGRAIRLGAINAFGLRPHELDQATQGTPAKYSACIAENEEQSPWSSLHTEFGLTAADSAVTAMVIRSCVHIEARHTRVPEQLAADLAGTIARTGALIHETISAALVLSPEHARLFGAAGWSKADVRQAVYERAVLSWPSSWRRARRPCRAGPGGGCRPITRTRCLSPVRGRCTCSPRRTPCWWWWRGRATPGCRRWWRRSARGAGRPLWCGCPRAAGPAWR